MNIRFDPKRAGCWLSAAALLALSAPSMADHERYSSSRQAHYDYARVLDVDPIVRQVSVETPVRECWEERHERRYDHRGGSKAGKVIAGSIIGGVIGHQFGSGRGNDAMTVVGSLLGAAIGADSDDSEHRSRGYRTESYPVERCDIRYETRTEERIDGYRVTYVYNGQTLTTRTNYDPGERLKVRVSVRPVD
ncbi:MAG: hypothetical protein AAF385_03200 [Pseudomonadota bacterium]